MKNANDAAIAGLLKKVVSDQQTLAGHLEELNEKVAGMSHGTPGNSSIASAEVNDVSHLENLQTTQQINSDAYGASFTIKKNIRKNLQRSIVPFLVISTCVALVSVALLRIYLPDQDEIRHLRDQKDQLTHDIEKLRHIGANADVTTCTVDGVIRFCAKIDKQARTDGGDYQIIQNR